MKRAMLVTGGTSGTGFVIAEYFAREGYDIFITSRDCSRANDAANLIMDKYGVYAKGYGLKVADEQDVINMFQDIDRQNRFVQTLVLNAANLGFGSDPAQGLDFFTAPIDEVQNIFNTNLLWNYMIVRQAAIRMRDHHKGAIVFISSATAHRAVPNRSAYITSKGGIFSMSKALAVDLGPYGIRCNVVLPGIIKTKRWQDMGTRQFLNGKLSPIGDVPDFDDIANAVWYLGSEASKNVTGAEIIVDGGYSCQWYPEHLSELIRKQREMEYSL